MDDFPKAAFDAWKTTPPDDGILPAVGDIARADCLICRTARYIELVDDYQIECEECGSRGPNRDTPEEAGAGWNLIMERK